MSVNRNRWQWIGAVEDTPLDRVLGRRDWRTTMTPEVEPEPPKKKPDEEDLAVLVKRLLAKLAG